MPAKGQEQSVTIRLRAKTKYDGDCRIWTGTLEGQRKGYGAIHYKGKRRRINRVICHLFHGADLNDESWTANHIPECKSSLCWNPAHLYVGTPYQNVQDQIKAGRLHYSIENLDPHNRKGTKKNA